MKLGVVFPQTEIGAGVGGVRAVAEAVEELGYQHLVAYDHVLGADPAGHPGFSGVYTVASQFHEPLVLFGYLAAVVARLEFFTGILILPQRQTALVAKQAAEVDLLSAGRLRLGVALGWNDVEYEALGMEFRDRGDRIVEQVDLLRRLWTEKAVTFVGGHHHVTAAGINPLPVQRPIPVWLGGSSLRAYRRAARLGDGMYVDEPLEGGWERTLERLHAWRREAGRTGPFGLEATVSVGAGTPDEWRAQATRWRELGFTHLSVDTMGGGLAGPADHIARLGLAHEALRGLD
jgi:probable F420-dependent oxidoreductase